MSKVAVLMATHNGARWVNEQLQSIIHHQGVDIALYVSDDMSTDETLDTIQQASHRHPHISLFPRKRHFGSAAQNFFRLIKDVDLEQFSYVALSDQDDIWLQHKLELAIKSIHSKNVDGYSSNVTAFWSDGKTKLINKAQPQTKYDYMFESAGPGCTFVMTKKLAVDLQSFLIKEQNRLKAVSLHDWFIYAFARSKGYEWYIDPTPSLLYRQHSSNVVGANIGIKAIQSRIAKLRQGWYVDQILLIADILEYQNSMMPIRKIKRLNVLDRIYLCVSSFQFRRRFRDRIAFALFILFLAKRP